MVIYKEGKGYTEIENAIVEMGRHTCKISHPMFQGADIRVFSRFGDELDKKFWLRRIGGEIIFSQLPEGSMIVMAEE